MRGLKICFHLGLSFSIALSSVTHAANLSPVQTTSRLTLISSDLNSFVEKISEVYDYSLAKDELNQLFAEQGLEAVRTNIGERAQQKQGKSDTQEQRTQRTELLFALREQAQKIVERIYKSQSISEFNLSLLVIAHIYLHSDHPKVRGALRQIVAAVANKVNEEYFHDLEKKSEVMDQINTGAVWTAVAITVASITRPVINGTKGLLTQTQEKLAARLARQTKPSKATARHALVPAADGSISNTAAIETLRRMGAVIDAPTSKVILHSTPSRLVLRDAIKKYLSKKTSAERLRNLMFMMGASYAGGVGYAAAMKLYTMGSNVDIGDHYLNPVEVFNRDYNGLAVLSLQCDIKGLLNERNVYLNKNKNLEGFWTYDNLARLNLILADYELLRIPMLNEKLPRYTQKTALPMPVKFVKDSWQASFTYLNKPIEEVIYCPSMSAFSGRTQVEVSLEDVLLDIDAVTSSDY